MCHWTNKLPFGIQRTLLLAVFHFILAESASNELLPLTGDACPGDVLTYTCTIVGSGNTIWSGSAFDCETKMNEIILRHSQFAESGTFGNCNDGTITTQSIGVVNNNCYSSQLNITVTSDMDNKTIQCAHSSNRIVTVGAVTLSVATAPPTHVRLSEVCPGELIFNWRASTDRLTGLFHAIDSNCGACPNMTNTTMITCSDFNVSTDLTMCTFSVRSVSCGTIGSPSLPIVVTLGVPGVPDATIIPRYSLNDGQSLTAIIVRVEQNVTSFSISDKISGSTTSYSIFYSGNNMQRKTACMRDTCEYTVDVPSTVCSTSSEVDVIVASANRLGLGPPSEPTTIECRIQFVKVEYNPSTTTISCIFENKLDSSQKSCSVKYGICDHEAYMYFAQNSTTDGSPSTVTLKLNTTAMNLKNCYVVTASNDTFTVMVTGKFETQTNSCNLGVIVGSVIGAVIIIILIGLAAATVIRIMVLKHATDQTDKEDVAGDYVKVDIDGNMHEPSSQPMTDAKIEQIIKNEYDVVAVPDMNTDNV